MNGADSAPMEDKMDDELVTRVAVMEVDIPPGSTVGTGIGVDETNGDTIWFAGDWRPMWELKEAVERGDEPIAGLEPWQIRRRIPAGVTA